MDWQHIAEVIVPTIFVAGVAWGSMRTGFGKDIKGVKRELELHRAATDAWRANMDNRIQLIFDKLIPDRK